METAGLWQHWLFESVLINLTCDDKPWLFSGDEGKEDEPDWLPDRSS